MGRSIQYQRMFQDQCPVHVLVYLAKTQQKPQPQPQRQPSSEWISSAETPLLCPAMNTEMDPKKSRIDGVGSESRNDDLLHCASFQVTGKHTLRVPPSGASANTAWKGLATLVFERIYSHEEENSQDDDNKRIEVTLPTCSPPLRVEVFQEMYDESMADCIRNAIYGRTTTFLSMGHRSSGKTPLMKHVVHQCLVEVFHKINLETAENVDKLCLVRISMIEVNEGLVTDLLAALSEDHKGTASVTYSVSKVQQDESLLYKKTVASANEAWSIYTQCLELDEKNHHAIERGHVCLSVYIDTRSEQNVFYSSELVFLDVKGSAIIDFPNAKDILRECHDTSQETIYIDPSLSEMYGYCFGGDSETFVLACTRTGSIEDDKQSLQTLFYASQMKEIVNPCTFGCTPRAESKLHDYISLMEDHCVIIESSGAINKMDGSSNDDDFDVMSQLDLMMRPVICSKQSEFYKMITKATSYLKELKLTTPQVHVDSQVAPQHAATTSKLEIQDDRTSVSSSILHFNKRPSLIASDQVTAKDAMIPSLIRLDLSDEDINNLSPSKQSLKPLAACVVPTREYMRLNETNAKCIQYEQELKKANSLKEKLLLQSKTRDERFKSLHRQNVDLQDEINVLGGEIKIIFKELFGDDEASWQSITLIENLRKLNIKLKDLKDRLENETLIKERCAKRISDLSRHLLEQKDMYENEIQDLIDEKESMALEHQELEDKVKVIEGQLQSVVEKVDEQQFQESLGIARLEESLTGSSIAPNELKKIIASFSSRLDSSIVEAQEMVENKNYEIIQLHKLMKEKDELIELLRQDMDEKTLDGNTHEKLITELLRLQKELGETKKDYDKKVALHEEAIKEKETLLEILKKELLHGREQNETNHQNNLVLFEQLREIASDCGFILDIPENGNLQSVPSLLKRFREQLRMEENNVAESQRLLAMRTNEVESLMIRLNEKQTLVDELTEAHQKEHKNTLLIWRKKVNKWKSKVLEKQEEIQALQEQLVDARHLGAQSQQAWIEENEKKMKTYQDEHEANLKQMEEERLAMERDHARNYDLLRSEYDMKMAHIIREYDIRIRDMEQRYSDKMTQIQQDQVELIARQRESDAALGQVISPEKIQDERIQELLEGKESLRRVIPLASEHETKTKTLHLETRARMEGFQQQNEEEKKDQVAQLNNDMATELVWNTQEWTKSTPSDHVPHLSNDIKKFKQLAPSQPNGSVEDLESLQANQDPIKRNKVVVACLRKKYRTSIFKSTLSHRLFVSTPSKEEQVRQGEIPFSTES